MPAFKLDKVFDRFSPGFLVILTLAVISTIIIWTRPDNAIEGMEFWVFADTHYNLYKPVTDRWRETGEENVTVTLLEGQALERRMMSSFFTGTPIADMLEVHTGIAKKAWRGPLDAVGYTDLTDILHETGLYEQFNEPSFSGLDHPGTHLRPPPRCPPVSC